MSPSVTDILPRVCEFFDLGPLLRTSDAGGYANRNLVLETGKGSFLAKLLRDKGGAALRGEADYLEWIAATGFPCPRYLAGRDGAYAFQGAGQVVAVMPFLQGEVSESISRPRLESLGAALARLHLIDSGALRPRQSWWRTGYPGDALRQVRQRFGDRALARLSGQIAALSDLAAVPLPRSIVHGDPWPGNAIFQGRRLVALVDWEETTIGIPLMDLAYLALQGCLSGRDFDPRHFGALIESYQSVRRLSPEERRCFGQAVRRVACINYLWLLLRAEPEDGDLEALWATDWYRSLELEHLTLEG